MVKHKLNKTQRMAIIRHLSVDEVKKIADKNNYSLSTVIGLKRGVSNVNERNKKLVSELLRKALLNAYKELDKIKNNQI